MTDHHDDDRITGDSRGGKLLPQPRSIIADPAKAGTKAGRRPDGKFAPGHSGNPRGMPSGSRHKTTMAVEALLQGEAKKLTRIVIDRATAGDMQALRIVMDRIAPPPKDRAVSFVLPPVAEAKDHPTAIAALLAGVASGGITPAEAQAVAGLLEQHRRSIELVELEGRIAALEDR